MSSLLQTQIKFVTNLNPICYKLGFTFLEIKKRFRPFVSGLSALWAEIIRCVWKKRLQGVRRSMREGVAKLDPTLPAAEG